MTNIMSQKLKETEWPLFKIFTPSERHDVLKVETPTDAQSIR